MSAEQELAKLADVPVERLGEVRLSIPGYKLILDHEVGGGRAYYERKLARPTWPGASSGVTIGVGYDLGYNTPWGMESRVSKLEENARRDVEWRTEVREELRDIKKLLMEGRK